MSAQKHGSAVLLGSYEPGGEEWTAARSGRLGASEIAAVMGLSPWQSPFSLYHMKQGNVAPEFENAEMAWGKILEDGIARWFAMQHPEYAVTTCGLYVNKTRDYQVAQPDRLLLGHGIGGQSPDCLLEIKTARLEEKWGKPGTDDIPVYYRCQALWQLDCLERQTCYVAVSISGAPPEEYCVEYDMNDVVLMRAAAEEFVASLETGIPPDLDGHEATYQAMRDIHPDIDGTEIEVSVELADAYETACSELTDAEAAKRLACARLMDAMGSARRAVCNDKRIAIRVPGRGNAAPHLRPARQATKREAA